MARDGIADLTYVNPGYQPGRFPVIAAGELWQIEGRRGRALQLRPKAADGEETTWALDEDATWVKDTPRGFYLRASFTGEVLGRSLLLPRRG